jgi:cell division septum initiation protein DivIVA
MDRREQQTELLPLLEGATTFDVVLRGYDRHQVHEHVERLEADLRISVAERDTVAARLTELAGQLAAAHNEIDALHARLAQAPSGEPSLDDVSDRIRGMLSLAQQEAVEIRKKAEQDAVDLQERFERLTGEVEHKLSSADRSRAETMAEAEQRAGALVGDAERRATALVTDAEQRATAMLAEAEHRAATLTSEADRHSAEVRAAVATLDGEADERRRLADEESEAKRTQASEDFEITLRNRRSREIAADEQRRADLARELAELRANAIKAADEHVAGARAEAERLVTEAKARAQEMAEVRASVLGQLSAVRGILDHVPAAAEASPQEWPTRG